MKTILTIRPPKRRKLLVNSPIQETRKLAPSTLKNTGLDVDNHQSQEQEFIKAKKIIQCLYQKMRSLLLENKHLKAIIKKHFYLGKEESGGAELQSRTEVTDGLRDLDDIILRDAEGSFLEKLSLSHIENLGNVTSLVIEEDGTLRERIIGGPKVLRGETTLSGPEVSSTNQVDQIDGEELYDPGEDEENTDGTEEPYSPGSHPDITKNLEEVNKLILEKQRKVEAVIPTIPGIGDDPPPTYNTEPRLWQDSNDSAFSPSGSFSPPPVTSDGPPFVNSKNLSGINIPSNLQEILASMKGPSAQVDAKSDPIIRACTSQRGSGVYDEPRLWQDSNDSAFSPSGSFTPPPVTSDGPPFVNSKNLSGINIPSNLQEILASIKGPSAQVDAESDSLIWAYPSQRGSGVYDGEDSSTDDESEKSGSLASDSSFNECRDPRQWSLETSALGQLSDSELVRRAAEMEMLESGPPTTPSHREEPIVPDRRPVGPPPSVDMQTPPPHFFVGGPPPMPPYPPMGGPPPPSLGPFPPKGPPPSGIHGPLPGMGGPPPGMGGPIGPPPSVDMQTPPPHFYGGGPPPMPPYQPMSCPPPPSLGPFPPKGPPPPGMHGPSVITGPHPGMGGPLPVMGGPVPGMGGPHTGMVGMGGPPSGLGGPPPSMGGPPPMGLNAPMGTHMLPGHHMKGWQDHRQRGQEKRNFGGRRKGRNSKRGGNFTNRNPMNQQQSTPVEVEWDEEIRKFELQRRLKRMISRSPSPTHRRRRRSHSPAP